MDRATHAQHVLHTTRSDLSRSIWYHGYLMTYIATGADTGGQFTIIETWGRRDSGLLPPKHIHHNEEESFYMLEGEATFYVDDEPIYATPGSLVVLPRDIPHFFTIDSEEFHWLNIITPAGFETFFSELGEPARSMNLPPKPDGAMDIPRVLEVSERHNVEIIPPA